MYFNFTSLNSLNTNLRPYLSQEGLVYKLTPERSATGEPQINLEKSYENLVVNANYSNLSNPGIYFNQEDYQARMLIPLKFTFNLLIGGYAEAGNMDKVYELSSFAYENLYFDHFEPSYSDIQLAGFLKSLNKIDESEELVQRVFVFFYEKVSNQLQQEAPLSRNDLALLQESSRLLEDSSFLAKYRELLTKFNTSISLQ